MAENTMVYHLAASEEDATCPHCHRRREFAAQERPKYRKHNINAGYGLQGGDKALAVLAARLEQPDTRTAELEKQLAAQAKLIATLSKNLKAITDTTPDAA